MLTGRQFKDVVYHELSRVAKSLADPKRLEILDLLCQSEKSVEAVAEEMRMSAAAVSHHLQLMKGARIVTDRRAGKYIYYGASPMGMECWQSLSDVGERAVPEIQLALQNFFSNIETIEELGIRELKQRLSVGDIVLIDVRPEQEYASGHIPGSLSYPLKELEKKIGELPKKQRILAYCRGRYCVMSKQAIELLQKKGYQAARLPVEIAEGHIRGRLQAAGE
jgi:DNA-binding transcriptional ArsR family regulator